MTLISWGLSIISILVLYFIQLRLGLTPKIGYTYFFVHDSNAILALTNGVTSFMWFKNLKVKSSKLINMIAASSFGVLLIHANSDTMRQWLWENVVDCVGHYDTSYFYFYAIGWVFMIYTISTLVDYVRIKTIETPILSAVERFCLYVKDRFVKMKAQ